MSEDRPLELIDLSHAYADEPVFTELRLSVEPGEFAAVLGASGCGKTTLLRCVAGLVTPSWGTVRVAGRTVAQAHRDLVPAEQRQIGLVFQDYALFPYLSVRENVGFGLASDRSERVDELLEMIGMQELADRAPAELSGGQQQRVAIARALAPRPRLLLLDEPFANVDASLKQHLGQQLQLLMQSEGTSVLLVTHDRAEALAIADRVAVMCRFPGGSRIVQYDTPERVYHASCSREAAELVGPAAFLRGEAAGSEARTELGSVALSGAAHGAVEIVLRPEDVAFEPDANGPAEVVARLFQSGGYRVLCRTPAGEILAETRAPTPPALGAKGRLEILRPCKALATPDAAR